MVKLSVACSQINAFDHEVRDFMSKFLSEAIPLLLLSNLGPVVRSKEPLSICAADVRSAGGQQRRYVVATVPAGTQEGRESKRVDHFERQPVLAHGTT